MITLQILAMFRRRLPKAPNTNINVDQNGSLNGMSSVLITQTMNTKPKKRLTPEVVAMLLSMDLVSHNTKLSSQNQSNSTNPDVLKSPTINDNISLSSIDIGMVEIVKQSGQPLGFSLKEYDGNESERIGGIVVSRLTAGGVVEQHSLLCVGDEILQINGVSVNGYKLSDVVAMIQIPKRLVLRVRFCASRYVPSNAESESFSDNNNNSSIIKAIEGVGSARTGAKSTDVSSAQNNTHTGQGLVPPVIPAVVRRNSSGRQLPAPPEPEKEKMYVKSRKKDSNAHEIDNIPNNKTSLTLSSCSEFTTPNVVRQSNEAQEQKSRKRPTMLPITNEIRTSENKLSHNREPNQSFNNSTRVDPGDIRFDIVTSNDHIVNEEVVHQYNDKVQKTQLSPRKGSKNTFGSSSSLSSSDSPKNQDRRPFRVSGCGSTDLSPFEIRCPSPSHKSTGNSLADFQDVVRKNSVPGDQNLEQKGETLLQNSLSDDLVQSHNSWFSKLNRKNVRKVSDGLRSPVKTSGKPYRVQDSTDQSNDEVDAGYRLYYGASTSNNKKKMTSRAVTGMVALHIVKACRVSTPDDMNGKDKRKKIKVFCSVDSDGIRQACTSAKKGFNNFQWNESFEIEFQRNKEINISVWIRSKKDGERTLAQGIILLGQLLTDGSGEHSLALCLEPYGTLYINLQFTDIKVLLQRTPSQKKEGVFGVPLETVLRRENTKIPIIIKKCVEEINNRGIEVIGIYRLCGNAAKKKILRGKFENNSESIELGQPDNPADVNVITGLLKDYLRELPQPLLSQGVREILSVASSDEDRSEAKDQLLVTQISKKFSRAFRDTIVYLLDHFVTVVMNSETNKMDSHNLAVCIGPVISCPSLGSMTSNAVSDTKNDINAVRRLLEIWPKPEQVSAC